MAGVDTDFQGETWTMGGTNTAYLPQEPEPDPSLNVQGNVKEWDPRDQRSPSSLRGNELEIRTGLQKRGNARPPRRTVKTAGQD